MCNWSMFRTTPPMVAAALYMGTTKLSAGFMKMCTPGRVAPRLASGRSAADFYRKERAASIRCSIGGWL